MSRLVFLSVIVNNNGNYFMFLFLSISSPELTAFLWPYHTRMFGHCCSEFEIVYMF